MSQRKSSEGERDYLYSADKNGALTLSPYDLVKSDSFRIQREAASKSNEKNRQKRR